MLHNLKSDKGQSLIEFALVLPVLLLLIFGIIEFGRIFNANLTVAEAARDAARYASLGATGTKIVNVAKNDAVGLKNVSVTIEDPSGTVIPPSNLNGTTDSLASGSTVQIIVSSPVSILDPILGAIIGNSVTVSSSVSMRVE